MKMNSSWDKIGDSLLVEEVLKNADTLLKRNQIKKKLPIRITTQALNLILNYLEESGKIIDGRKGILWISSSSETLNNMIHNGTEV